MPEEAIGHRTDQRGRAGKLLGDGLSCPVRCPVLGKHLIGRDDRHARNNGPAKHHSSAANPSAVLDLNRGGLQLEGCRSMGVATCTKVSPLRNADVRLNRHIVEIVDPDLSPDPAMVPYRQPPRILDSHIRMNDDTLPDSCAKGPQHQSIQAGCRKPSILQNQQAHEIPNCPQDGSASGAICRILVSCKIPGT